MRLLITGGSGLLGSALAPLALERGHEVVSPRSSEFDITDPVAIAELGLGQLGRFDWILNLAAYTKVDLAETEREAATGLNAVAPGYLAQAASGLGAKLLHFSTDYVFDGEKGTPYTEEDAVHPIQHYGATKAEGERAVLEAGGAVARVSWLFGPNGPCFPSAILKAYLSRSGPLRVVSDQFGVPSSTLEVARITLDLVEGGLGPGAYHVCGTEAVSRIEYARIAISAHFRNRGESPELELEPVSASEFPTPARRPDYSVLSAEKVGRMVRPHAPLSDCFDWI